MCQKMALTFCLGMFVFLGIGLDKFCAAQTTVIIAEGEYVMGSGETMEVAEERAKKLAMQNAAEQAGAFVKSYSEVKNFILESDVIEVIANHSMQVEVIDLKKTVLGDVDAIRFYVKIQATMSEEEIEANLKKVREDQSIVDAYTRLKADYEKQNLEMEQLKNQLAVAVGADRKKIAGMISEEEKKFKANLWVEKAQTSSYFTDEALDAYKKAVELNPDLAQAYVGMADVLRFQNMGEPWELAELEKKLEKLNEALAYLDTALSIDQNYADAYAMRAGLLEEVRNTERSIHAQKEESEVFSETEYNERIWKDINRAIALGASNKADLCQKRAWFHLGDMQSAEIEQAPTDIVITHLDKAIADINQAIALCEDGDLERLSGYCYTKAKIYDYAKNYYIRKDDAAKEKQYEELAGQWFQKAGELAREKEVLSEQAATAGEELMQTTEIGKLFYELEMGGWRQKAFGAMKEQEGMNDEERQKIMERKTAELKDRIASGAASAEDYLWVAYNPDESVESRRDNYEKGLALLEARNPEGRDALLLVQLYIYEFQFLSDEQQYDNALEGLNKAQTVVDRHLPRALNVLSLDDFWKIWTQMIQASGNPEDVSRLNKEEAEALYWIRFALQVPRLRAQVYEKLELPSKAMEEYRYLCETLRDEEACKDVERLR